MKFSLRQLMALVTAVAVLCAVMFALPALMTVIVLCVILLSLPTVLISVIVYGQGYSRAFSIGALWGGGLGMVMHLYQAYVVLFLLLEGGLDQIVDTADETVLFVRIMFAAIVVFNVVSGLISTWVYWVLRGRKQAQAKWEPLTAIAKPDYSVLHGRLQSVQFHTVDLEPVRRFASTKNTVGGEHGDGL